MNGKSKGSSYERKIAKELSLWISEGKDKDLLWRTALSGGRASTGKATVGFGDLGAIKHTKESKQFCDTFCVELKCYSEVSITKAFFNDKADMRKWWSQVSGEAAKANLVPMLIAKGNRQPALMIFPWYVENLMSACLDRITMDVGEEVNVVIYKYEEFISNIKWRELYKNISSKGIKYDRT